MAAFLAVGSVRVRRIVHSGKTRARETAEILSDFLLATGGPEVSLMPGLGPTDPVGSVADQMREWSDDTLVAGHQPFMGRLVALLAGGTEGTPLVVYTPGTVVCLERAEDGTWGVLWMVRPELLPG